MDNLAWRHLNVKTIAYAEVAGKGAKQIGFDQVSIADATAYSAEDADITLQLHRCLYPRVAADPKLDHVYATIEMPVREVLFEMEREGVMLDAALLAAQSRELGAKVMALEQQAYQLAGQPFNLASPKQLGEILFDKMKLPTVRKTATGQPSTDEDVLTELAADYPLPKVLLEHRALSKLKSTYTDKLPQMVNRETGRVHTTFSQATAVTGRLASSDPNLQNIPVRTAEGRRIREAFIAPAGSVIVSADYSQIELRIMAHLSSDPALVKAFHEGADIHKATAADIFGVPVAEVTTDQRRYIKAVNFGLIYGMGAFGLAQQLGIERSAAQQFIDRYFQRYPGVRVYMEQTREFAREHGYVETVFGRRLWLPDIKAAGGPRRAGAERAAINAPMQGTAADLVKLAMIAVRDWIRAERLATKLVLQVHDELVLEVPGDRTGTRAERASAANDRGCRALRAARRRRRRGPQLGAGALGRSARRAEDVLVARVNAGREHRTEDEPAEAEGDRRDDRQHEADQAVDQHRPDVDKARDKARLHRGQRFVVAQHDERRREPVRHHQRQRDQHSRQRRQHGADAEGRQHRQSGLDRIAGHERGDPAHPDGADRDGHHDGQDHDGTGEAEESDDEERSEAVGKSGEEVMDREFASAILRAAPGHDPGRERGSEDRRREAADQRDQRKQDRDHDEGQRDRDPHPRRRREEAPAFCPPGRGRYRPRRWPEEAPAAGVQHPPRKSSRNAGVSDRPWGHHVSGGLLRYVSTPRGAPETARGGPPTRADRTWPGVAFHQVAPYH